jgi:hypothetical protein
MNYQKLSLIKNIILKTQERMGGYDISMLTNNHYHVLYIQVHRCY